MVKKWVKLIMKRKFKQWWSSIPPISTKRTVTSHLYWTQTDQTYDVGNQSPGLGQVHTYVGVKPVNEILTLPLLITGSPTVMHI